MYKIKWFFLSVVVISSMGCATSHVAPPIMEVPSCFANQAAPTTQVETSFFQSIISANPGVGSDELSAKLGQNPIDTAQITPSAKYQIYQTYVMSIVQQLSPCPPVSQPSTSIIAVYFKDGKMVGQAPEVDKYSDLKSLLQLGAITQVEYDNKYALFQKDDQIASLQQQVNAQQQQLQQQQVADQQQADDQQQQLQQQQQAQQQAEQDREQSEQKEKVLEAQQQPAPQDYAEQENLRQSQAALQAQQEATQEALQQVPPQERQVIQQQEDQREQQIAAEMAAGIAAAKSGKNN